MKTFRLFAALLAVALLTAPAFPQESSEATALLAKARRGNGIAQYNLGLAYAEGKGVAADPVEAYVWLTLARENGARGRALDNLMGALDKNSLDLAQHRLTERKTELGVHTPTPVTVRTTTTPKEAAPATKAPAETAPPAQPPTEESLAKVQAERDALSAERARLIGASAEHEKTARTATEANQALQDQAKAAEAKAAELAQATDTAKGELARAKLALAAAQKAAKPAPADNASLVELEATKKELDRTKLALAASLAAPKPAAPDTTALDQKTRELQAALAELETARSFGRKVEDTLNRVNEEKTHVAQAAATELEAARAFGSQVESTLNKVTDQKTALESALHAAEAARDSNAREFENTKSQLAALTRARDEAVAAAKPVSPSFPDLRERVATLEHELVAARASAPAYPDLSGKVAALEKQLAQTKPAAPAYPDLSGKVAALEKQLAQTKPAAPAYPDLSGKVAELQTQLAQVKAAAPAYPDLRSNVTELETKAAALAAENTRGQQQMAALTQSSEASLRNGARELDATKAALAQANNSLSAKPSAPAYPNLAGRVAELETTLANLTQKAAATELARTDVAKQFEDYKSATASAQRERTTLLANVKLLESDKVSLRHQAESAGTETAQLRTQVATLKDQLSAKPAAAGYPDLRGRVTGLEADLVTAKQLLAAKSAGPAYPDLTTKVGELETSLRDSTRQLASASTEADRAKREVASLNKALEAKAATATPDYPDYTGLVKDLTAEVTKLRADRAQLQQSLASAERQSGDLAASSSRVKELEAQVGTLQAAVAAQSSVADRANQEVAALTKAKEAKPVAPAYPDLSGKVAELEAQLAKPREPVVPAYPNLCGRVSELESALAAASTSLAQTQSALAAKPAAPAYPDLSGRVTELETQLAQAKAPAATPAAPDLSGHVSELESALADSARKLVAADHTQTELRQQLATAQDAGKNKGEADIQLQRERLELTGHVTILTGEVAQLRDDRERMQKMLGETGRKLRDSSADASRIKELETQAAALQASLSAAQAQTGELQTALAAKPAPPAYPDLSGKVTELQTALAAKPVSPTFPDLRERVTQLERDLAAVRVSAPAYPDLSGKVAQLEGQLSAAASSQHASAYPDLSGRVSELESSLTNTRRELSDAQAKLAQTASQPATAATAPAADTSAAEKQLAETQDRLSTALRGYALLEKERDALQTKSGQATEALVGEKNALAAQIATLTTRVEQLQSAATAQAAVASTAAATAQAEATRLNESLAALQRSTGQTAGDAATARTLVQQLQGANTMLAQENYQLKTMLARNTSSPTPAAPVAVLVSPPAARMHVVVSGDSLSKISLRYYGTANRWQEIYNANTGKLGPNGILRVGTELRIP